MRRSSVFAGLALGALPLAACVAPSEPPPRPAPPVAVPAAPVPAPAPPPRSADWRDWPLTPGTWTWRPEGQGSVAAFGLPGQAPALALRCDRARGRLLLSRPGQQAPTSGFTIRTTSSARTLAVTAGVAELGARDSLVDAMGYSRGRFLVEGGGMPTLVVPAWAEILRVAEDCRG